ncbi:MAG TPA: hypothetical protein VL995_22080 [Cellvibrio sp.]|nr:hypothetical protein [Cellvibrio sp.]
MTIESRVSSGNVLMDLRIVILRTIASVWEDDKKKEHDTVRHRLVKLDFSHSQIEQFSESKHLNNKMDEKLSLREILINLEPDLLNIYFERVYNYVSPFTCFGVKFINGSAIWNYYGDDTWTKPEGETISLTLPNFEKDWNSYEKACYLMQFYNHFPSFFGTIRKDRVSSPLSPIRVSNLEIDFSGNDYNLGVAEDDFLSFGALINKIVATAWHKHSFMKTIDYDMFIANEQQKLNSISEKVNPRELDEIYYKHIVHILKTHYDFDIPWAFNIKFQFARQYMPCEIIEPPIDSKSPFWTGSGENWTWFTAQAGRQLIRNVVSLEIPIAPDNQEENVSLALARYNLIGPAYPFTCS